MGKAGNRSLELDGLPSVLEIRRIPGTWDATVPLRKSLFNVCHGRTRGKTRKALQDLWREYRCRLPLVQRGICGCPGCHQVVRSGRGWRRRPIGDEEVDER